MASLAKYMSRVISRLWCVCFNPREPSGKCEWNVIRHGPVLPFPRTEEQPAKTWERLELIVLESIAPFGAGWPET